MSLLSPTQPTTLKSRPPSRVLSGCRSPRIGNDKAQSCRASTFAGAQVNQQVHKYKVTLSRKEGLCKFATPKWQL